MMFPGTDSVRQDDPPLLSAFLSPVHYRHGELKDHGESRPEQVRDIDVCDPARMRPDDDHRPNEREEKQYGIDRGEQIILQAELKRREGEIENEIENERQEDGKPNLSGEEHSRNLPERYRDEDIQHEPHRTENEGGRRPLGLEQ